MSSRLSLFHLRIPLLVAFLFCGSCQLPPELPVGNTVRRAESPNNYSLFFGAGALGVPYQSNSINDFAKMLAGMEFGGGQDAVAAVRSTSAWPYHQQAMNSLWYNHEYGRGGAVRHWAAMEIGDLQRHNTLFYPFSGPDYLFAQAMFPSADTYILCGLEPAEPLPNLARLTPTDIAAGLSGLRDSLSSIMGAGYFITVDMRNELVATRFRGVLPILLAFLARTGAAVDSVDLVRLDALGNPVVSPSGSAPGLMIRFRSGWGVSKRLFYFRQDLSNGSLSARGPFLSFVSKQGYPPALIKSASYLMHGDSFSVLRNYLLRTSVGIVQDPSGIPFRHLADSGHSLSLYGNYQSTLGIFSQQQPDLVRAYRGGSYPVEPLNFGFGYLMNPSTSSIIVARRR